MFAKMDASEYYLKINSKSLLFKPNPVYKPFNFPWAFEAWKTQQRILWLPEEIPMIDDIKDWNKNITDDEKRLLTNIFRFFTQSDIGVHNCYYTYYSKIFHPIELKMMLTAFANTETIHIHAYDYLVDTLGLPITEYSEFLKHKEMMEKWDYMQEVGDNTLEGIAITLARFGAFTEGVQLFAAFAILMNFPRFNKMKGMGQVITWSIRDETLHMHSIIKLFQVLVMEHPEVLTSKFKKIITEDCKSVVQHEDAFVDFAFGDPGKEKKIDGITAEETKLYIRHIADRRLAQLGLDPIYDVQENPFPWMEAIQNEYMNFFEGTVSEYSRAQTSGTWEEAFENVFGKNNMFDLKK